MKTAAVVLQHQRALRARALDFWNKRQTMSALWQAFLVLVAVGSLFASITSSIAVKRLTDRIIVTDRVRETDRFGQTVGVAGATYALPRDPTRHKLLHDFVSCVFDVEPNYQQMQAQTNDCLTMIQADGPTSTARATVLKYWADHNPLRPDGTWMTQLSAPVYVHVTSYVRQHVLNNGEEEWTVELTLENGTQTAAQPPALITTDITLSPHAAATDADPFGLLVSEFSWDFIR